LPATPHVERHFTGSESVRDVVIGMADGLTVPFALAAGLSAAVTSSQIIVTAGLAEVAAGAIVMGLADEADGDRGALSASADHEARAHHEVDVMQRARHRRRGAGTGTSPTPAGTGAPTVALKPAGAALFFWVLLML
jgi:vacuolar iron transporter family protein